MVDRYVEEELSRFIIINLMVSCTNRKPELSQQRMGRCRSLVGKEGDRICFSGDLQKFSLGERAFGEGGNELLGTSHCLGGRHSRLCSSHHRSLGDLFQTAAQEQ